MPCYPAIHVPTLVIQRLGDRINPPFYGRYLASHIPGARYFEQPGDHVLWFASESTTEFRVLITQHLRGFRHDTEGVFDDRAGTFSRQ